VKRNWGYIGDKRKNRRFWRRNDLRNCTCSSTITDGMVLLHYEDCAVIQRRLGFW
jgi:hypothetical protein